ncbi:MAG: flippase-like domain-containing protein [Deltaproteobacteria bacterium]|nr:flippase-like domain-containing protein [Deltaproteobacteria bacterium]MBW2133361.1 flippase-like domain-containing protein [Deltaproteobacteria bacterium]
MTRKNGIYLTASVLVTVLVMGLLFRIVSLGEVVALIRNITVAPAVGFVLLSLAQTGIQAWRYSLLLGACRVHLSMPVLFLVTTARNLFSDLLPARVGTLSYVLILTGRLDVRIDKALSGFALAFVFDILVIFPMVALALLASRQLLFTELRILFPAVLFFILFFWILLRYLSSLFRVSAVGLRYIGPLKNVADAFEDTARQVENIREKGVYGPVFLLSLVGRILKYGKLFFLLLALLSSQGYGWRDIGLARFFLGVSSAEFAASLPISGIAAFGAYEGAWALVFSLLGFPKALAVSTGISHHLITQVYGYSLGVLALLLLMIPGIGKASRVTERPVSRTGFFMQLALFLALIGGLAFLPLSLHNRTTPGSPPGLPAPPESIQDPFEGPSPLLEQEKRAIAELTGLIRGRILYSRSGRILKQKIGDWTPQDLGEGEYARWSPSGKQIAVYHQGSIFVMKADGTQRRKLLDIPHKAANCPIEFHSNGKEILFINPGKGLWVVRIDDGKTRPLQTSVKFDGEPGISSEGNRIAVRQGNRLFAVDLETQEVRQYGRGCSPGISPDGTRLMQNLHGHRKMLIRDFKGNGAFGLSAATCLPDGKWDNHHWSNHADFIAAQGNGDLKEVYVISVSQNRCYRVTWIGATGYPDLFVEPPSQS